MGRPKNRTLYKKKGAENWYYYQPGFGSVDTGTNDRFSAEQALKKTTIVNPVVDDVRSALAQLSAQMPKVENTIPIDDVPKPAPTPTPTSTEQPITTVPLLPRTPTAQDVLRKLSPDKRERLMSALSVGCSRINALAVELALNQLGRKVKPDFIVSDSDLELMSLGYSIFVQDIFEKVDPKWWHVVIAGNVMFALSVLPNTEKVEKKSTVIPPESDTNG